MIIATKQKVIVMKNTMKNVNNFKFTDECEHHLYKIDNYKHKN